MLKYISRLYLHFLRIVNTPLLFADYFDKETGKEYDVGFFSKLFLFLEMRKNNKRIISGSNYVEHLIMATKILRIPKSMQGSIVECGCYKGVSTTNLSLVASLCNRKLEVFDSFKGLPKPASDDKAYFVDTPETYTYKEGDWAGSLEEVRANISRYGKIDVCTFHAGFFDTTLPACNKKCVFIFLDVDLRESLQACLKNLWPLLQEGGYVFTHEAADMQIVSVFFNKEWWQRNLKDPAPGLVGGGCGLGLIPESGGFRSDLAYTIKHPKHH